MKPKNGDLKIWWVPQVPMRSFYVPVKNLDEAKLLLRVLADYDTFQYATNIKPDYSNAGGLAVFENGEWVDWEDEEGRSINDIMDEEKTP